MLTSPGAGWYFRNVRRVSPHWKSVSFGADHSFGTEPFAVRLAQATFIIIHNGNPATGCRRSSLGSFRLRQRRSRASGKISEPVLEAVSYTHLTLPTNRE